MRNKFIIAIYIILILIFTSIFINLLNLYSLDAVKCTKNTFFNDVASLNTTAKLVELFDDDKNSILNFENFDNDHGTDKYIIPNVVHLIYLNSTNIKFYQAINIYSIFLNHKPDLILLHCDNCSFDGYYWREIQSIEPLRKLIRINKLENVNTVFGKKFRWIQHKADIWRLLILMNYGGIYLDNDVYVVRSLDEFRKFEMVLSIEKPDVIGNQVLIAHKNARFLKSIYDSYRTSFNSTKWYYNGGVLPGQILKNHSKIAHVVPIKFGTQILFSKLYKKNNWQDWKTYYTIHLLMNHRRYLDKESPYRQFNEINIKEYKYTYAEMATIILDKMNIYKANRSL